MIRTIAIKRYCSEYANRKPRPKSANSSKAFTNNCAPHYFLNDPHGPYAECEWPTGYSIYAATNVCPHESTEGPRMTIAREDGRRFTLLELDAVPWSQAVARSSRGGEEYFLYDIDNVSRFQEPYNFTYEFSGQEWHNIEWFTVGVDDEETHGRVMIDNLRFELQVPEPGALSLFVIGLAGLVVARRRG